MSDRQDVERFKEKLLQKPADGSSQHIRPPRPPLPPIDGNATSGGMSDDWKAAVDGQLRQLHADIRALLIAGIAATGIALTGLYVLGGKVSDVQVQAAKTDGKIDLLLERTAPKK